MEINPIATLKTRNTAQKEEISSQSVVPTNILAENIAKLSYTMNENTLTPKRGVTRKKIYAKKFSPITISAHAMRTAFSSAMK